MTFKCYIILVSLWRDSLQKKMSCWCDLALDIEVFPGVQEEQNFSLSPRPLSLRLASAVCRTGSEACCHGEEYASGTGDILCDHTPRVLELCRLGNERLHCRLCILIFSAKYFHNR